MLARLPAAFKELMEGTSTPAIFRTTVLTCKTRLRGREYRARATGPRYATINRLTVWFSRSSANPGTKVFPPTYQGGIYALEKRNIAVVARQTYDPAATDLTPQVAIVRDAKPDVVINSGYPADTARLLRTLRQLDVRAKVISARTLLLPATRQLAGEAGDGALVSNTVDSARPDVKKFLDAYAARFGAAQPTMFPVVGYDGARIAFKAMENPKVLEALDKGRLADARQALRDAIEATGSIKGLQGQEGSSYFFGPKNHSGSPDKNWYTFLELTGKGTRLVKANMATFKPAPAP